MDEKLTGNCKCRCYKLGRPMCVVCSARTVLVPYFTVQYCTYLMVPTVPLLYDTSNKLQYLFVRQAGVVRSTRYLYHTVSCFLYKICIIKSSHEENLFPTTATHLRMAKRTSHNARFSLLTYKHKHMSTDQTHML